MLTAIYEYFNTTPNWAIQLIIGAILGAILAEIVNILNSRASTPNELNRYRGKWYSYYYAMTDSGPKFFEETWKIKWGFITKNKIIAYTDSTNKNVYVGNFESLERDHIIIAIRSKSHESTVKIRFLRPAGTDVKQLIGIGLTYGFNGKISANPCILSQDKMTESELNNLIIQKYSIDNENAILSLK